MSSGEIAVLAAAPVVLGVAAAAAGVWATRAAARYAAAAAMEARLALERQREFNAVIRRAGDLAIEAEALDAVHRSSGVALAALPPRPADSASVGELERWAAEVESITRRHEADVRERVAERHQADFVAALRAVAAESSAEVADYVAAPAEPSWAEAPGVPMMSAGDAVEAVAGIIAGLDAEAPAADRIEVHEAAAAVATASPAARRALLAGLGASVRAANTAARKRRRDRGLAEELLRDLDGLDGGPVLDLRALLSEVVSGDTPLLDVDVQRVASVRQEALAALEGRFVADQLARSFERLGYRVEPGFVDRAATTGVAYSAVPDSPDHGVEVQIADGVVDYRLVRVAGAPRPEREAELERHLCAAMSEATADAVEAGASAEVVVLHPPGTGRVAERTAAADRVASASARQAREPKERER